MSTAPAGWYEDPSDDGAPRCWTGVAWLAPGEGPAAAAPSAYPAQPYPAQPSFAAPTYGVQPTYPAQPSGAQPTQWGSPAPTPRRFLGMTPLAAVLAFVGLVVLAGGGWFTYSALTKGTDPSSSVGAAGSSSSPKASDATAEPSDTATVVPTTGGQATSPSGRFTYVVDPTWIYDSNSVAEAVASPAPGETPVAAWWSLDPSIEPTAAWIAVSEYALPGTSLEEAHRQASDALVADVNVTTRTSAPVDFTNGVHALTTTLEANLDGTAMTAIVYSFGSDGHFLTIFALGAEPSEVRRSMDYIASGVTVP